MSDDNDDSRHQRFIIDIGDRVHVRGQYEWNDLGGLVHWTHDDPQDIEDGGWIRYRRKVYA